MTTGRINQVATAVRGVRPTCRSVGRPASHVQRSPHRSRARVALARRLNGRFSVRSPRRPDGPRIGRSRRGPDLGRRFLSPSRHPLRGRNTQDGQARNEPRRVAHRSDLDRQTIQVNRRDACRTAGTLAPVAAGRLRDCLVSRQSSPIESEPSSPSLDVVPTGINQPDRRSSA